MKLPGLDLAEWAVLVALVVAIGLAVNAVAC
jgi:hypothetical protein